MDKEIKKTFIGNIVKFIIWGILLSISFIYLQNHPAEKASVFSWFEVMYQRVEVFVRWIFGNDSELLKQKHSLERYYEEMIRMAEDKKCIDVSIIKELNTLSASLKKEKLKTFEYVLPDYVRTARKYDQIVQSAVCE